MADKLTLIGPDGLRYDFDPSAPGASLEAAQAKGFRVETKEEPRTLGEAARAGFTTVGETVGAGLMGALEGATFGLTKPLTELAPFEKLEARPVTKGIGEFAGMLFSPANEIAAVGKLAKAGRFAEAAVGGAAIGALGGAGQTVGEHLAGDSQLNGEKLAMNMGLGALLGTGGGLVGEGIIAGAEAIAPKLKGFMPNAAEANEALTEFAEKNWNKALSGTYGGIKNVPLESHPGVAEIAREFLTESGDLKLAKEAIGKAREAAGQGVAAEAAVDLGTFSTSQALPEARTAIEAARDRHLNAVADEILRKGEELHGVNFGIRPEMEGREAAAAAKKVADVADERIGTEVNNAYKEAFGVEMPVTAKGGREESLEALEKSGAEARKRIMSDVNGAHEREFGIKSSVEPDFNREDTLTALASDIDRAQTARTKEVAQVLEQKHGVSGLDVIKHSDNRDEALTGVAMLLDKEGKAMGKYLDMADKQGVQFDFPAFWADNRAWFNSLNEAEKDIIRPFYKRFDEMMIRLEVAKEPSRQGFRALNDIKSTMMQDLRHSYGAFDSDAAIELKQALVGRFKDAIDANLERGLGSKLGKEFKDYKKSFGVLSQARKALKRQSSRGSDFIDALANELGVATPSFKSAQRMAEIAEEAAATMRRSTRANGADAMDIIAKRLGVLTPEIEKAARLLSVNADAAAALRGKTTEGMDAVNAIKARLGVGNVKTAMAGALAELAKEVQGAVSRSGKTGRDALEVLQKRLQPDSQIYADAARNLRMSEVGLGAMRRATSTANDALNAIAAEAGVGAPVVARGEAPSRLTRFRNLAYAEDLLEKQLINKVQHRSVSLSTYLTALTAAVTHGSLAGLATVVGHQWLRDEGSRAIAMLADRIVKSKHLEAIAGSFAKQVNQAGGLMGAYAGPMQEALRKGPAFALATHMVLMKADPDYEKQAAQAGFVPEDADTHQASMVRAHSIAQLAEVTKEADRKLDSHIGKILKGDRAPPAPGGGSDFGNKSIRKSALEVHDKRADEILALAGDPEAQVERIAANIGNLANVAPGTAASMSATAMRAIQHLAAAAARPAQAGPLAPKWVPSEQEKAKFARIYHAVVDPESVLQHAAAGTMTRDEMQALEAVYPALTDDIRTRLLDRLTDGPTVPYSQRMMISMVLGTSADGSSSAKTIVANQQAIRAQPQKESAPGGAATPARADKLNVASRFASAGERRQMKED